MENKKNLSKSIIVVALVLSVLAVAMVGAASAKSSYVIADHSPQDLRGYNINADGTVTWSKTYTLQNIWAPTDVAVDESSKVLFVTGEGQNIIEIVDATTMASLGTVTATGASDLAGIEADNASNIVYTVDRGQCNLYAYDWNAGAQTLTTRAGFPKTMQSCTGLCGIALDETTNTLYAADWGGQVLGYDTNNLGGAPVYTVTPSTKPVDVAVDRQRQKLYTTCPGGSCGWAPGYNGNKIIQIDIATGQERHLVLPSGVGSMGVAVEEIKGYVHFTEGCSGDAYKVYDPSTTPWTQIDNEGDIGDPAGLCIPQEDVVISDLNLVKTDITTSTCVNPGGSITYDICFDNTKNPNLPLTTVVIVDDLPPETTHVSGGSYNAGTHQATWNIGPVAGGAAQQCVQLTVDVTSATAGDTLTNYATIDSDQTSPETVYEQTTVCSGVGPTVESADGSGNPKDIFQIGDPVYAIGSGYTPGATYMLYVMNDQTWTGGESLAGAVTTASVTIDPSGNIPATQIWASAVQGLYDIVVDVDGSGTYSTGDAIDGDINVGFEAVPEFSTIAIPVASILGLLFFFNYRKRRREQ